MGRKSKPPEVVSAGRSVLSENKRKFHEEWTSEDCLNELRRIAEIDTTHIITRNYFRVNSPISESTWSRYFGTFQEFKRQARLVLSRHAHKLERNIAQHASGNAKKQMNESKQGWEGKYLLPSSRRWQTVMVINDIHDRACCPFYRRVVLATIGRVKPEKLVINGDLYDLPEFSKHTIDPRGWDVVGRIKWVHTFLRDLRQASPDTEITLVEGNHEARLLRHLSEQTPAMKVLLSDLHSFTVSKLLGLDEFGVNFIARCDLTAFTERDIKEQLKRNYIMLWNSTLLFGHFPEMRNMGIPGASGHHHKHIVWPLFSPIRGPGEWHQVGCGHKRQASYCAGEKWGNGFLLAHADTKGHTAQFEYIDTSHDGVMIGGLFYSRTPSEVA